MKPANPLSGGENYLRRCRDKAKEFLPGEDLFAIAPVLSMFRRKTTPD
ncbi:hypothetical protein DCCM_3416 [Desulfocucumis palustris]|uniref:Uncharacterized protein n=1 Tax=Desulfocucumis palustris TaxID=1898651 RepID=A0A2L2XE56_9FIRM|nr:hypothetical protein [Desulfocucumis palustris]GBF34304.1 hypothetical protein DCCM_3416 [Desulfocucumis palustris]